jgi:hypothetical protein
MALKAFHVSQLQHALRHLNQRLALHKLFLLNRMDPAELQRFFQLQDLSGKYHRAQMLQLVDPYLPVHQNQSL